MLIESDVLKVDMIRLNCLVCTKLRRRLIITIQIDTEKVVGNKKRLQSVSSNLGIIPKILEDAGIRAYHGC